MKAKFKFNSGNLAPVCSRCSRIIKHGVEFTQEEHLAIQGKLNLPNHYCNKCATMKTKPGFVLNRIKQLFDSDNEISKDEYLSMYNKSNNTNLNKDEFKQMLFNGLIKEEEL